MSQEKPPNPEPGETGYRLTEADHITEITPETRKNFIDNIARLAVTPIDRFHLPIDPQADFKLPVAAYSSVYLITEPERKQEVQVHRWLANDSMPELVEVNIIHPGKNPNGQKFKVQRIFGIDMHGDFFQLTEGFDGTTPQDRAIRHTTNVEHRGPKGSVTLRYAIDRGTAFNAKDIDQGAHHDLETAHRVNQVDGAEVDEINRMLDSFDAAAALPPNVHLT